MSTSNEENSNTSEYIFLDHTNIVQQLNTTHTNIVFCFIP